MAHIEALAEIQPDLPPPKPEKPAPKKTTPRKRKAPSQATPAEPRVATRRSGRVVMNQRSEEEKEAAKEEEDRLYQEKREQERIAKHGPRQIEALAGITGCGEQEGLIEMFNDVLIPFSKSYKAVAKDDEDSKVKVEEEDTKARRTVKKERNGSVSPKKATASSPTKGGSVAPATKAELSNFKAKVDEVEHRATVKIVPERIYAMVVHPHSDKEIIFAGDKSGHVGVWDATQAGLEDEDGDATKGSYWHWKQHYRTVSTLKFAPHDYNNLYSGSYDCTLRRLNFETGIHEEVIDADHWDSYNEQDNLIHSFDFDLTGHNLWAVDNQGGLIHRDLREPMEAARRWAADAKKRKIGGVSVNPSNPSIAVTAHLRGDLKIWDIGKLADLPEDAERSMLDDCVVATNIHKNAVSSAYFDRTGTNILTTSYDDKLRVFEMDPWKLSTIHGKEYEPVAMMNHDCQVGRFVSVFKAQWSMCPTLPLHLHVGNMKRTLDVYAPVTTPASTKNQVRVRGLMDDSISAVPAVTASHPIRECVYAGGNSSGKVSLYTLPT
ncbi:hypothetical protein OIO90_000344 [Microbotryomycetes sp. JL221]|nr:hypothetical protein OIO90_000344 [Microbotryomycetes sp. JL221]